MSAPLFAALWLMPFATAESVATPQPTLDLRTCLIGRSAI
jgi:hypothetical protein